MSNIDKRFLDWRWRLNHLYKIIDKEGNLITFKEKWIQSQISDETKKRKMVLKYRQGGVTTGEILKQLDFVCFNENKTACIMADKSDNMEKIFRKVRLAHKYMPKQCQPQIQKGGGSKYEMIFPNMNSRIYCTVEGRGDTIHWLHISEAAFAHPDRVKATLEAVPPWGIVTYESTPNGMGNDFYQRWVKPSDSLAKLFFPWYLEPGYELDADHVKEYTKDELEFIDYVKRHYDLDITREQIAFRRQKQYDLGDMYDQEYPENDKKCFLASGDNPFNLEILTKILERLKDPLSADGELEIYEEYDSSKHYAVGGDTAEGKGGDSSVATVFEVRTRKQVAQFKSNKLKPRLFAIAVDKLARMYWKPGRAYPLMGIERNNHGHAVLLELEEHLNYPNLYYYKEGDAGWLTNSVTRPVMIDTFIDGVEDGVVELNSRDTVEECLTLVNNNGKIEAEEGYHDDCVIAGSIALQMCIEASSNIGLYDNIGELIHL